MIVDTEKIAVIILKFEQCVLPTKAVFYDCETPWIFLLEF